MIISASRRTDIPAFFAPWFCQKLREGAVETQNPYNAKQTRRVPLNREEVDGFVFWTKNPAPFFDALDELKGYTFYFQFTLNAYGTIIEPRVPLFEKRIQTFKRLSERIGAARIIWRYDPVFLTSDYTIDWHERQFAGIVKELQGAVENVIVSFIDIYKKNAVNIHVAGIHEASDEEENEIARRFSVIARAHNLNITTCAEEGDFSCYGITHGVCIDAGLLGRLSGKELSFIKDKNQRAACGCVESVDIGTYRTCSHRCIYCYAN